MRIALLASAACIHTVRWANALAARGLDIELFTLHPPSPQLSPQVRCHVLPFGPPHGYVLSVRPLRHMLAKLRPDLLHAHYASGYGTLARLVNYRPYIVSVWGSDVLRFPARSRFHRYLIRRNLFSADLVCSTSHAMARHVRRLLSDRLAPTVIPFGVETNRFTAAEARTNSTDLVIGTVKTLRPIYGIDTLITGFAQCREQLRAQSNEAWQRLKLRIVGGGYLRDELEQLAARLGIAEVTQFVGPVTHDRVPDELRQLDVYVAVSRSESFGVAVIEASACELPVVVSDVGGLPEVVHDGQTGLVVPPDNPEQLAAALARLITDRTTRRALGQQGRRMVQANYEWSACIDRMIQVYEQVSSRKQTRRAA